MTFLKHTKRAALLCGVILTATAIASVAQPAKGPVEIKLTALKVVQRDGKETLQADEKAKPGEVIEYQARYSNNGSKIVRNLEATLPIPTGFEFLSGSTQPMAATASTDGKTFAPFPLKRIVKAADGTPQVVLVPQREYRALRWNIGELSAGKDVTVTARVKVLGTEKPASSTTSSTAKSAAGKEGLR